MIEPIVTFSVRLGKRKVAQLDKLRIVGHESSRNDVLDLAIEVLDKAAMHFTPEQLREFLDREHVDEVTRIRQGYIELLDSVKEAQKARNK